jgi:anti-sigma regulatory factor (Ser/Thr protein kinase)
MEAARPAADSSSNGGPPSTRAVGLPRSRDGGAAARAGERKGTIESLTVAVGKLHRGAAALKAENRELRAEIAGLEREGTGRRSGDAPIRGLTRLAEIALPAGPRAPGAARCIVDHCLSGLVTQRVLHDAELLVSELVTNSLQHGELRDGDGVLVSVYLASDRLRLEIQNPGTAGVVAASRAGRGSGHGGFGLDLVDLLAARWGVIRSRNTRVWFEMARV